MKYLFYRLFLLMLFLAGTVKVIPCTTGIISGKITTNGRPILFKHRDSNFYQNRLMFFNDGEYDYIGLVNSIDLEGKEVWAGTNSTGFSIINSASYNLKKDTDTTSLKDREGVIMKIALQQCASLEDFENLLNKLPKPLGVEANFGVIDANGGAAYYETDNFSFTKVDVNDPKVAPFGYLIRTNYSFSGNMEKGYGYIRYETADELLYTAAAAKDISPEYIIQNVSRSLRNSLTKTNLYKRIPQSNTRAVYVNFQDFIPRYSSVATVVIEGVNSGQNPELTTMWTVLGFPLCSVVIPVWTAAGNVLPDILTEDDSGNAPLCEKALKLKKRCFPISRGSGEKYLNVSALLNSNKTGILQKLISLETEIYNESRNHVKHWEKVGMADEEIKDFYRRLDKKVKYEYSRLFGL